MNTQYAITFKDLYADAKLQYTFLLSNDQEALYYAYTFCNLDPADEFYGCYGKSNFKNYLECTSESIDIDDLKVGLNNINSNPQMDVKCLEVSRNGTVVFSHD